VDALGKPESDNNKPDWDGQDTDSGGAVVGRWPDGTAITDAECHAPDDARELRADVRRYKRVLRWSRRRTRVAALRRMVGNPRVLVASLLLAAFAASAVALLLPAAR
jgi:hypothetical protein